MWFLDHFEKEETRQEVLTASLVITALAVVLVWLIWAVRDVHVRDIEAKSAVEQTEQLRLRIRLEELKALNGRVSPGDRH